VPIQSLVDPVPCRAESADNSDHGLSLAHKENARGVGREAVFGKWMDAPPVKPA